MADNLVFRQGYAIDPFRAWARKYLPGPKDGMVLIDADVYVRRYGPSFGLDGSGDLMGIEKKEFGGQVTGGEGYVYRFIDRAMKGGAPDGRWRGNHILRVRYSEWWPMCEHCKQPITTNETFGVRLFLGATLEWDGNAITHEELRGILMGDEVLE